MPILVIAEHSHQNLHPATLSVITAALQLKKDLHVFVGGYQCKKVANQVATVPGVQQVIYTDHLTLKHPLADSWASYLKMWVEKYSHILAPATTFGKDLLPRLAALLNVGQLSDVIVIDSEDTFKRPIYAGNAIATVQSQDPIKVITIRPTAFEKLAMQETTPAQIVDGPLPTVSPLSRFIELQTTPSNRPELSSARVVVSGGRALQGAENFKLIEDLAACFNGAIGASRAAVDAGYVPNDYQVGQTGKVVAPELYIAIGISGAIQHLAGMKDSKVIVAINKDPDAPIFQVADYGLVGDLFDIIPDLIAELKKNPHAPKG
jgi:electron transfer flavoprotein alpha subunit